jgi:hypothetical protein
MSRKKITGESKLAGLAELAEKEKETEPEKEQEKLRLVTRKMKLTPTSFRLSPEDRQGLKSLLERVNDLSPNRKISETMMIKALIKNAGNIKPERLINMVRDVIL